MTEDSQKSGALLRLSDQCVAACGPAISLAFPLVAGVFQLQRLPLEPEPLDTEEGGRRNDTQNHAVGVLDPGQQQNRQCVKDRRLYSMDRGATAS
jgi:hypothetical protein